MIKRPQDIKLQVLNFNLFSVICIFYLFYKIMNSTHPAANIFPSFFKSPFILFTLYFNTFYTTNFIQRLFNLFPPVFAYFSWDV